MFTSWTRVGDIDDSGKYDDFSFLPLLSLYEKDLLCPCSNFDCNR